MAKVMAYMALGICIVFILFQLVLCGTGGQKSLIENNKINNQDDGSELFKLPDMLDFEAKSAILLPTIKNHTISKQNKIVDYKEKIEKIRLLLDEIRVGAVTATPKPPTIDLNDIFISVKTTKLNHDTRLDLILKTWYQLAEDQTWFFTDGNDKYYSQLTHGHLINTNCSNGHSRKALCCKMSVELDTFLDSQKKWFCHFDDDNYVNVPRLLSLLNEYDPKMEWYLGKPSVASPLEIHLEYKKRVQRDAKVKFWFATGGAGFCISRALGLRMLPIAGGGKLISIGDRIRFPDDVTIGFIIEHLLNVPLTVVDQFHSHLEPLDYIRKETFQDQVSFSYGRNDNDWNVIQIDSEPNRNIDPTRFHSLHCHLFPKTKCKREL